MTFDTITDILGNKSTSSFSGSGFCASMCVCSLVPNAEHTQQDATFSSDACKQQLCYLNQNFGCKDLSG